jgi:hypothetical protein
VRGTVALCCTSVVGTKPDRQPLWTPLQTALVCGVQMPAPES